MNSDIAALLVYRLAVLLCGFGSIVMGYRLFRVGVFERAGELKATLGGHSVLLKAAAPGTFFALFGAAIVSLTVWKGFTIETAPLATRINAETVFPLPVSTGTDLEYQEALRAVLAGTPLTVEQRNLLTSRVGLLVDRKVSAK